jgi:hypothetical protein
VDRLLARRREQLRSAPAVDPVNTLTSVLEIGDIARPCSINRAISLCGMCGTEKGLANMGIRATNSKRRDKHNRRVPVEAAKLAPRQNRRLFLIWAGKNVFANENADKCVLYASKATAFLQ